MTKEEKGKEEGIRFLLCSLPLGVRAGGGEPSPSA